MYDVNGAWSRVADASCNKANWNNISAYLRSLGVKIAEQNSFQAVRKSQDEYIGLAKASVDGGGGLLHSTFGPMTSGHIYLVIGYTDDDLDGKPDRVVVNDPWTDLMPNSPAYTLRGNGAIYSYKQNGYDYGSYISYH